MAYPPPPFKALLPAPKAADDELPVQAHRPNSDSYPERLYLGRQLGRQLINRIFFSPFQDGPFLPISNDPLVPRPPPGDTTSLRHRVKASRDDRTHARVPSSLENIDCASMVDEQTERGEGDAKNDKASFCKSTLPGFDIRRTRHNERIEELKKVLETMSAEDGSAVVLLCWGEETCCSILPVSVSNPEDEVATWREINKAWYTRRGHWRKHLPGFSVTQVDIVEVCYRM